MGTNNDNEVEFPVKPVHKQFGLVGQLLTYSWEAMV